MNNKKRTIAAVLLSVGLLLAVGIAALVLLYVLSRAVSSTGSSTDLVSADYDAPEIVKGFDGTATREAVFEVESGAVQDDVYVSSADTAATVAQKIIKTASLIFVVENVSTAVESITSIATDAGGFVESSETWESSSTQLRGTVTVRVPADTFEMVLERSKELALVVSNESVSGQDVTEEYTDLAARLANAQKQEEELRRLLERAANVEEILKVQKQLHEAREEVEVLQGRINYLENQTSLSTVTFDLREEASVELPSKAFRPIAAIKDAARALVTLAQNAVIGIIWVVIVGGGILLPIILVVWIVYRLARKSYRKHQQTQNE